MGAPKRQKLRRGQLASGEEFFYLRRPLASRAKLRIVTEGPGSDEAPKNVSKNTSENKERPSRRSRKTKDEN